MSASTPLPSVQESSSPLNHGLPTPEPFHAGSKSNDDSSPSGDLAERAKGPLKLVTSEKPLITSKTQNFTRLFTNQSKLSSTSQSFPHYETLISGQFSEMQEEPEQSDLTQSDLSQNASEHLSVWNCESSNSGQLEPINVNRCFYPSHTFLSVKGPNTGPSNSQLTANDLSNSNPYFPKF